MTPGLLRFLFFIVLGLPLLADSGFTIRRTNCNDIPRGKGQCDIRLQVDNEVEVRVRGVQVDIRTISGRDARDDGSECNEPLPDYPPANFNFEVKDSRGDIALVDEPSRRNGFSAIVRIRDPKSGEGRYHFRLTWALGAYGNDQVRPGDRWQDRAPDRDDRRDRDDRGRYDSRDYRMDLRIISAKYGYGRRMRDVTNLLRDYARTGRIDIRATNETLGGDPAVGDDKQLFVTFEYQGRRNDVSVREGDRLRLP